MTRAECVVKDFKKTLDDVNKTNVPITDKALQMISQSLLSISISLAQILDVMTSNDAEGEE